MVPSPARADAAADPTTARTGGTGPPLPLYILRSVRHALADRRDLPSRAARALVSSGAGRRLLRRACEALGPLGTATGRGEAVR